MANAQPLEAHCDHCRQTRPLWLYQPEHTMHLTLVTCDWCDRDRQPLLCTRCWSDERIREETAPVSEAEDAMAAVLAGLGRCSR